MAIKTFSDGNSLPASDINTYLTNSGLVYVKSQTVGTGVASVTVSSAFSTDFDNYKIQWSGSCSLASGNALSMQLGATAAGYYGAMIYSSYAGVAGTAVGDNNVASWTHCAGAIGNQIAFEADLFNPFKAQITTMRTAFYTDGTNTGAKTGYLSNTTSYTAFTLIAAAGTLTGGTITVYGYRKA
jgi:hypothetical protein